MVIHVVMAEKSLLNTPIRCDGLSVPNLSMTEAQALNIIAKHGSSMNLVFPVIDALSAEQPEDKERHETWNLCFSPMRSETLNDVCTLARNVEWSGGRLRVYISSAAITSWLNTNLPVPVVEQIDELMVSIAFETLIKHIFSALDAKNLCGQPLINRQDDEQEVFLHSWTLTARHIHTGLVSFAMLKADTLGLMLLANLIKRHPENMNSMDENELPIVLYGEVGWTILRVSQLSDLAVLDTIFIDHYRVTEDGEMWLVMPGYGLRVRPLEGAYCVTQEWTPVMNSMSDLSDNADDVVESTTAQSTISSVNVDELPVRLTFSLGSLHVTLGELRNLHPGAIFNLEKPLSAGPVIVRANGRLLGSGDLVSIDGRIGVTLRELGEP
jgi:type III secretion protein Q